MWSKRTAPENGTLKRGIVLRRSTRLQDGLKDLKTQRDIYPLAERFPMMDDEEFSTLAENKEGFE